MTWGPASAALLGATADGVAAILGDDRRGTLPERLLRTMRSYAGRDLWRATLDWRDAVVSELISRRAAIACDVAIVGGGPLALALSAAIRAERPEASVLAINATCGSRTYEAAGRAFALNTENGTGVDRHPLPGVRLADLCEDRFPPAIVLADAVRLSAVLSGCEVWSWARVVRLRGREGGWLLDVQYGGRELVVSARQVVIATGFGAPRGAIFSPELRQAAAAMPGSVDSVPGQLTAEAFLAHACWGTIAHKPLGRTAVVGGGPSALAVLSLIFDLAPPTLAHIDASAMRQTARVTWFLDGEHAAVIGLQRDVTTSIGVSLHARYAALHGRLARATDDLQCVIEERHRVREVRRVGAALLVDGEPFDTVIDCTGYEPYQVGALLPGFEPSEVRVFDDVGTARGCHLVGDVIMPLLPEDAEKGPLEQWAGAATRLGRRLAQELPQEPIGLAAGVFEPRGDDLLLAAPTLPCRGTAAERIGARLALTSARAALPMVVRAAEVTDKGIAVCGALGLVERALNARNRSLLVSSPEGSDGPEERIGT